MATAFGAGTVAVHDSKNPAWTRPVRRLRGDSCPVTAHALPEGCCEEQAAGAERCAHGGGVGLPLAVSLTGGIRHDVTPLMPLLDALPVFGEGEAGHGTGPTAVRRSRQLARRSELA